MLIGRSINEVLLSNYKNEILFITNTENIVGTCFGDCCSTTWIEHVENTIISYPVTVISVEDIGEMQPSTTDSNSHEFIQYYGCKIVTDRGTIVIDYRNSSNGYYGW